MKLFSIKNNNELCEKIKAYCKENWIKVYDDFAEIADKSVTAEMLPQTWVLYGKHPGDQWQNMIGFYQLAEKDHLTVHSDLTPFITTLFVDPAFRGGELYGKALLDHAREQLGQMGYDTAYLHSDLIGYYERYGFAEIGLDITDYSSPTKVYSADTLTDIRYEIYDKANPKPDHVRLAVYQLRNPLHESKAWHLWFNKTNGFPDCWKANGFTITAFSRVQVIGAVNFLQAPDDLKGWYLGDLHVEGDFRRQGIASKMLRKGFEYISRISNGGEYIYAYIEKDNEPSIGLHKKLGCTDTGEVRPFGELIFGDDETTWVKYL